MPDYRDPRDATPVPPGGYTLLAEQTYLDRITVSRKGGTMRAAMTLMAAMFPGDFITAVTTTPRRIHPRLINPLDICQGVLPEVYTVLSTVGPGWGRERLHDDLVLGTVLGLTSSVPEDALAQLRNHPESSRAQMADAVYNALLGAEKKVRLRHPDRRVEKLWQLSGYAERARETVFAPLLSCLELPSAVRGPLVSHITSTARSIS